MTISAAYGTTQIGVKSATNVYYAVRYSAHQGRPITLHVILNWDRAGIIDPEAMVAFRLLKQKVSRAWKYRQCGDHPHIGPFNSIASHENPDGHRNTHWLAHVPQDFVPEFKRLVMKFLRVVIDGDPPRHMLEFRSVTAAGTLAKYILKGIDPRYRDHFHMEGEPQGFIAGKGRTSVSRGIGPAARARVGWRPQKRR